MTADGCILDDLPESVFGEHNFYFWVRCVIDAMDLLGPETDDNLKRMCQSLLDYHSGADVASETIDGMTREIVRLGVDTSWKNTSPLGLKYRCLWAIASSRKRNLADLYDWQYGVVTAFENLNLHGDKDQALNVLIRGNALKYGIDLHETENQPGQGLQNVAALLTQAEAILNLAALLLAQGETSR